MQRFKSNNNKITTKNVRKEKLVSGIKKLEKKTHRKNFKEVKVKVNANEIKSF